MSALPANGLAVSRVAIGGDHAGFSMKNLVGTYLKQLGIAEVVDCGPEDECPCDFPDFAEKVARLVLAGKVDRGILICGSGVGVSVAANKIPGIHASICHDTYSARQGVEHDDMNVLCVGARIIGEELVKEIVRSFLTAKYSPQPRHKKRVDKIDDLERRAMAGEFNNLRAEPSAS
ncbi:ribose 5-phosphate isomerase B [Aureliella helgolandensis]|uniref:Ribose-5-phosphate isomerase B n=1 Tax=Aureliella helgolandensis TaxID=2527968 RepID=A0A518G763_9BACT|nr:ribose 5-phosphate isomerase B [Aureliella helgolandensis]QDV24434.1 Ribose-5-phosphate isomerase B [Aureliella helgolandensis]